jgi:phenylacetate-CoA ligase
MDNDLTPPPVKCVFTDSEILPPPLRRTIEKAFQAPVFDVYGTFETENVAYECHRHRGYHIAADCVLMEFLRDGQAVASGEEGEIVCTVLDNLTTPFIRYNLHDLGMARTGICPCGRRFPLMSNIVGRSSDYLRLADGRQIPTTLIAGRLHAMGRHLHQYQVVQQRKDLYLVRVVPTPHFSRAIEDQITDSLRTLLAGATVQVETVASIAREKSGKHFEVKLLASDGSHS